jgi:hypothetical protein
MTGWIAIYGAAIKQMVLRLPTFMSDVIKVASLVGLRSAETVEAVRLINDKEASPKLPPKPIGMEHFRFQSSLDRLRRLTFHL